LPKDERPTFAGAKDRLNGQARLFEFLFALEEWFPRFFGRYAEYLLIVLKKSDEERRLASGA
jgi:hypothetical protein